MRVQLNINGMSQYDESVNPKYRKSACGPTTTHVILNYICTDFGQSFTVNELYKILGGTIIGLFKWRLIRNLRKLLGPNWIVETCTLNNALQELNEGRPVAMKFDKYFKFQWWAKPTYKYHWVPLIGYEINNKQLYLIFHDNGGRRRKSKVRTAPYHANRKVLSFVKIVQKP